MAELQIAIIPVTAFQQNCTLIWDSETKEGVVIDPGGDNDRIRAAIAETGMQVGAIWLTHGHIDHAAGAMDLKEELGVEIIGPHKDDLPLLQGLEKQAQMIAHAVGGRGPNTEYLYNTVDHLTQMGIRDADMDWLVARVKALTQ